jgi:peptide/nickel transport system permease protein
MTLPAEGLDLAPEPDHAGDVAVDTILGEEGEGSTTTAIQGRSLRQIAWRRLKQDKVALTGGVVVLVFVFVAIFAKPLCALYGQSPNTPHQDLLNPDTQMPIGPLSGMSTTHWLGIAPVTGYDILANLIYGARTSLVIASLATLLSLVFGVSLGLIGGYFRGSVDMGITWLMDLLLSFPVLLFSIALLSVFAIIPSFLGLSGAPLRFAVIIFVLGFFGFPYIGRIVRGQVLSLREKEFVDAARSLGASNYRIMSREIIPNVLGPILVYTTLTIPNYMLGEAGLSYLGVGVPPGTPSWGQMLSDAGQYFQVDPWYLFVPGMTIFIAVLAFNLFGDGLRDALDPRSTR